MREGREYRVEERAVKALAAWRALLREAGRRPWLAGLLARRGAQIFGRFVQAYERLCSLPRRLRRRLAATLLGAALLFALGQPRPAQAATIIVDGTTCALPDAITAANTDMETNGCTAGDVGADTIELQTDVTLSAPLPVIDSPLTLNGNGHTIDGDGVVAHVLQIYDAAFTLNEATITGGNADDGDGGGIYNGYGTVTINRSTITGNSATFGGGGIMNFYGEMTINNSTISGNSSDAGGGVANLDTLTISNSTITGNTAYYGGGLYNGGGASSQLNRTIISGNDAQNDGDEIYHSEFEATLTVDNYNVFGYNGSERSFNFTKGATDLTPTGALSTVLNTTLMDNNGATPTHALVSGSAAVDLAPSAACEGPPIGDVDQRGFPRNVDGDASASGEECDAGAFEYGSEPTAIALAFMRVQGAAAEGLLASLGALALGAGTTGYGVWRWARGRLRKQPQPAGRK